MSSLSQALRLEDLPSSHSAFQGHAAHIIEWPTMLRPKDSEGTCIPSGVTTFLQTASRRSPSSDYDAPSATPLRHRDVVWGLPLPTVHCPWPPERSFPCSAWKTQVERGRWRVALLTPSALCGSPILEQRGGQGDLCHHCQALLSGLSWSIRSALVSDFWLDWLTS